MSKARGDSKIPSPDVINSIKRDGPAKVQQPRLNKQGMNQMRQSGENNLGPPDRKQQAVSSSLYFCVQNQDSRFFLQFSS